MINNNFINLKENFKGIMDELNSSLKIIDFEWMHPENWNIIDNEEIIIRLRIINEECQKIRDFLKEYLKFDDGLTYIFNTLFHEKVKELALDDFQRGEYLNAVRKVFIEINHQVKEKYKNRTGKELDGYKLMVEAFNPDNIDVLSLNSLSSESERNIQNGYRWFFAGSMLAIRNPSAHENITLNKKEAFHYLSLGSELFYTIDKL